MRREPGRGERLIQETDPLVISAMRKVCHQRGGHPKGPLRAYVLTPEERAALNAWLNPRLEELVERWAQAIEFHGLAV